MLTGKTQIILHLGYPTHSFKAPLIYNPYFAAKEIDALVSPVGLRPEHFGASIEGLLRASNVIGALITMPHKVKIVEIADEVRPAARVAGSANAVKVDEDGKIVVDMFDGEGFVRGMIRNGQEAKGASALVVGSGGVGSGIAASLAAAGVARLGVFDVNTEAAEGLARRLRDNYDVTVETGTNAPDGFDIVVNATPLGMNAGDPMPLPVERLVASQFVGEVVMKQETTPFLQAARDKGCRTQVGIDMLFEQIPAYLEFFGLPSTTAAELRELAAIEY